MEVDASKRCGTSEGNEIQVEKLVYDLFITITRKIGKDSIWIPGTKLKYKRLANFPGSHPKWDKNGNGEGANAKDVSGGDYGVNDGE